MLQTLKEQLGFDLLVDVTCVDYLDYRDATDRFGLVYLLANTETNERITVRTFVNDPEPTRAVGGRPVGRRPTGWSARCGTCSASASTAIPTCGGSSCPRSSTAHPLRKDYPLQGRGERHNFPVIRRGEA